MLLILLFIGNTSYSYDTSGKRLSKTVNGTTTQFYYAGDLLVGQKTGNNIIEFMFDSNGDYFGLEYNGTPYYYIKNLQGDVIAICNNAGNTVVTYEYDAWGKLVAYTDTTGFDLIALNPIRYRSYYYDRETGFYYLKTRYYSPEICRFLSPDVLIDNRGVNTQNLFAYCANNPINFVDSSGTIHVKGTDACGEVTNSQTSNSLKNIFSFNALSMTGTIGKQFRRPNTGEPGSTFKLPNGDWRKFGPDGRPQLDYDHDDHNLPNTHPHDENGGHYHDWDWTKDRPRQKPYVPEISTLVGVGLVAVCAVGVSYVVLNDVTVIGLADDFMVMPLVTGVVYGIRVVA